MTPSEDQDTGGEAPAFAPVRRPLSRLRGRALSALRVGAAGLILFALAKLVGTEDLLAHIAEFPLPVALACVLLALLAQFLGAMRLGLLARSQELPISTAEALGINLSAIFYSLFLPGGNASGWAVRLWKMAGQPAAVVTALAVLAGDRAIATAVGASIGIVADTMLARPASAGVSAALFAVTIAAGFLAWVLIMSRQDRLMATVRKLPLVRRFALLIGDRGRFSRRPGSGVLTTGVVLSLATHLLGVTVWVWLAWSVGLQVDALTIAWVRSVALVVGLLPVTIGGLGLREGTVVYLLTRLGLDGVDALLLSLMAFAVTVLAMGVLGGLAEASRLLIHRQPSKD